MLKGEGGCCYGKIDSIHHRHWEAISGTAAVLELKQKASIHHPLWVVVVYKVGLPINVSLTSGFIAEYGDVSKVIASCLV